MKFQSIAFVILTTILLSACSNSGAPVCDSSEFKNDFTDAYKQMNVDNVTKWMGEKKGQRLDQYMEYSIVSSITEEVNEEAKRTLCTVEIEKKDHEDGTEYYPYRVQVMAYRQEDGSLAYRTR